MRACNARITWYREPGHIPVEDVCVLENGHMDFDHLPAQKATEQGETRVWNAAIDAGLAAAREFVTKWDETAEPIDGGFDEGLMAAFESARR